MEASRRDALLRALAPAIARGRGVASRIAIVDGEVLDGAVDLRGDTPRPFFRPLPDRDASRLGRWIELLIRQRAQLTHAVSGPVTGVLAAVELCLDYEPIAPTTRPILEEARAGLLRLGHILVQRDALGASPERTRVPLRRALERWVEEAQPRLDPLGYALSVAVKGPDALVALDGTVAAAVDVLLTNAVRSARGTPVELELEGSVDGPTIWIALRSPAATMPPEAVERAGELGYSARYDGLGLGLFSVRWALRDRGGTALDASEHGVEVALFFEA